MEVIPSNTCMICFGKESAMTLQEYLVKCKENPGICAFIKQSSCLICKDLPHIIEVVQREPINLADGVLSHERYMGRNLVTVPGEIQHADWLNTIRAGATASFVNVVFAMHGSFNIPSTEFGKLTVTDNHMNYEQACVVNQEGTIQRTHHDERTQDSCWVHTSDLDQTQGMFYEQCICCRAVFDGIHTVSLLPPAPLPVYHDNIVWADTENAGSENYSSDVYNDSASDSEDEETIQNDWLRCVRYSIATRNEESAMHYLAIIHESFRTRESLPDEYLYFLTKAIQWNCTNVFDCLVPKYIHAVRNRAGFDDDQKLSHRLHCQDECLRFALATPQDEIVPASTLLHVVSSSDVIFTEGHTWNGVFAVLFHLPPPPPQSPPAQLSSQETQLVLSKFKILLDHGANPLSKNVNRRLYSACDEFTEWCVCTNATNVTINTGFSLIIQAAGRLPASRAHLFDSQLLFTENTLSIICRKPPPGCVPRIPLQYLSVESIDTTLRMLKYYKECLQFPLDVVDRNGCNAFFYTTSPQIVRYLFDNGINPAQRDNARETAIYSILSRVSQDCSALSHTQDQVNQLQQCLSRLLSYGVGTDQNSLLMASTLINSIVQHSPIFETLRALF